MSTHRPPSRPYFPRPLAPKVPEITAIFWVVKLLTTAGGEATSDWLANFSPVIGAGAELLLVVIGLVWQFRVRRYTAAAYWFLAFAIAIFGTGVSDTLHVVIGLPYAVTSILWALILAGVFLAWYRSEHTLSVHGIVTRRREVYYWLTVFATFALGTALGDFTATTLALGYLSSVGLFAAAIAVPLIGWRLGLNPIAGFWWAYVLTRPLGASVADYVSKSPSISGLGFGDGRTALACALAVAAAVVGLTLTRADVQRPDTVQGPDAAQRPDAAPPWDTSQSWDPAPGSPGAPRAEPADRFPDALR